ncbi:MAG: hypothetical protein P4M14_00375 [Gammaproteobacteria bacterium]|nr:hypothetical protein [Gammaproteobacteria bacterium]
MLSRLFKPATLLRALPLKTIHQQMSTLSALPDIVTARNAFFSYTASSPSRHQFLTRQQPYEPHSVPFLDLQMSAMQKKYAYPKDSLEKTTLKKGQILRGLTGNIGLVYGGVPLYQDDTLLSLEEAKEIAATITKLGCHWAEYVINQDVECIVHTTELGEKRWYVSDQFLDELKKPTPVKLRF